jgi:hypothetical protein
MLCRSVPPRSEGWLLQIVRKIILRRDGYTMPLVHACRGEMFVVSVIVIIIEAGPEVAMKGKTIHFLSALLFCMAASFVGYGNDAAALCNNGPLAPGSGEDLVITDHCKVGAGVYKYGNVNIIQGGVLEFIESPRAGTDFWAKSILVENNGSLIAGTPAASMGMRNGTFMIHLYGSDTDRNDIECKSPVVNGVPCGIPESIWISNPPPTTPNPASCTKTTLPGEVSDCFYQYTMMDNVPGETGLFGRKVLAVSYGGTLQLFGKKGATYRDGVQNWDSGMSWARFDNPNSRPGQEILNLDRPVDWERNDRVVLTTTDYLPGHSEELDIMVKGDQRNIWVRRIDPVTNQPPPGCPNLPLIGIAANCGTRYAHNGDLYPLNNLPERLNMDIRLRDGGVHNGANVAETRAAVALLTRDIRIVSGGNSIPERVATASLCRVNWS